MRLCILDDDKKSKQDLNNVVVPDALLNRRQRKRDKMYEYVAVLFGNALPGAGNMFRTFRTFNLSELSKLSGP